MSLVQTLIAAALASLVVLQPAAAQNKAALAKSVAEFDKLSRSFASSYEDLGKRVTTASPNDKEMLKLVLSQLALADLTVDATLDLGLVASEVRDAGDQAIVKKHLALRCKSFKAMAESSAKYIDSVAANIAAVATAAEARKAGDLLQQMGQHPLCGATASK